MPRRSSSTAKRSRQEERERTERLRVRFAFGICAVWMIAILVSLATQEYAVLTAISPVMMTISGFLFGSKHHSEEPVEGA